MTSKRSLGKTGSGEKGAFIPKYIWFNCMTQQVISLLLKQVEYGFNVKCHYVECHYAECHGTREKTDFVP